MAMKRDLDALLGAESARPAIRRGQGMRLSTELHPAAAPPPPAAHPDTPPEPAREKVKRVNREYKLRKDLVTACKQIAQEQGRDIDEIIEDALVAYLARLQHD